MIDELDHIVRHMPVGQVGALRPALQGRGHAPPPGRAPFAWERALLVRVRAGDPVAERAFYDQHVDWVYRLAMRVTRDAELARDLTQETFIRAFARLAQFRGEAPVGVWLRRVAVSVLLNGVKRVTARQQCEVAWDDVATEALTVADAPAAPEAMLKPEGPTAIPPGMRSHVAVALATLSPRLRAVVLLHDVDGYSHVEIAAALEISVGNSKVRLSRARAQLRAALTPRAADGMVRDGVGSTSATVLPRQHSDA